MSRRLAHPFLATALVVGTVLGFAAPAFAHHTTITGVLECDQAGNQLINWTVNNSESNKTMTLEDVDLTSSANIPGLTVGYAVDDVFIASETRPASTTVPGTAAGTVTLDIDASWPGPVLDGDIKEVQLDPNKCKTPAAPSAEIAQDCVDSGVDVVLRNTGGTAVTFVVHRDGTPVAEDRSVAVGPGLTVPVSYPLAEGATAGFMVTAPGMGPRTLTMTRNCQNPGATATLDCLSGLVITLTNNGGQSPVDFTVVVNGVSTNVSVPANPDSLPNNVVLDDYNIGEDEMVDATVSVLGSTSPLAGISDQKKDCQNPAATVSAECGKGAIVTLSNSGGESDVIFEVMKNGVVIDTVTVEGGTLRRP